MTDAPGALPAALAAHAARLLDGTGLSVSAAARAAAGDPDVVVPPGAGPAVQALRDGYDSAARAAKPEPETDPGLEAGGPA